MISSRSSSSSSTRSEEELPLYAFDHGAGAWPRWSSRPQSVFLRYRRTHPGATFFGSAAVLGSLFYVLSSSLGHIVLSTQAPSWYTNGLQSFHLAGVPVQSNALEPTGFFDITPGGLPDHLIEYSRISSEDVSTMLASTDGFFARDYSLHLGWNNMRYIIEAAFLQARILNRVLILPSFVYARACEYSIDVCAEFADMVNKNEAMNTGVWSDLPLEQQMGYRIPIPLMLNITAMRAVHPVVLVSDFLRLHDLPLDIEVGNGHWGREAYHTHAPIHGAPLGAPDLYVVKNEWYDEGFYRVDVLPEDMKRRGGWVSAAASVDGPTGHWEERQENDVSLRMRESFDSWGHLLPWKDAIETLRVTSARDTHDLDNEEGVMAALHANGWEVLQTFLGVHDSDDSKAVIELTRHVAPRSYIRGWYDDYANVKARVLLLEGEVHNGRKPGTMRFTTIPALKEFQRNVLYHLQPPQAVQDLAAALAARMAEKTDGRLWMGAHMRRGDFVTAGWATDNSPENHMRVVKGHLAGGREILENLGEIQPYPIPEVQISHALQTSPAPQASDFFYVATDERDPAALAHFRSQGAVLLPDLLTQADRRTFGWPLMITDIRAIVEQELLAHSAFFTGTRISSVAGGILNMRAAHGADRRTTYME
ncbi:unnamed protein product [Peniophora sp. CBMAI 1063]|nr:unnamed protein product [Peniophora sp. CBMAI 1063]